MKNDRLQRLRDQMRKKDQRIVRLLNERSLLSIDIGELKIRRARNIVDTVQEKRVYRYLEEINNGPLADDALQDIFREIISASRALQEQTTVAFLGPEGSFSHLAALSHFGKRVRFLPKATIGEVFDEVERENVKLGITPVENSTEGSVKQTLDRLISTPLQIQAEVFLRIRNHLLSSSHDIDHIRRIYSHPQAIAQCRSWLRANLPHCLVTETTSTAKAAKKALKDPKGAAIGSGLAASAYNLQIIRKDIEDHPLNTTRFFVIGKGKAEPTGHDKSSVLFGTLHVPGALCRALTPFAERRISLTRIESYPLRDRMWEYLFLVDFLGHVKEEKIQKCLQNVKKKTAFIKTLGSYPKGDRPT